MTIGQRIAQKRKEQGLSQEALGERLGVSRQSVYKWESDSALPEIDKLIAMSRFFGVTVGWLLGVEEPPAPEERTASAPEESGADGELNETQLKMVKEIVDCYIAAQPKPGRKRLWPWVIGAAAVVCVFWSLFGRLDTLNNQYVNLQDSVNHVRADVNNQIYSITNRVEEVLKSQNDLTADYVAEIVSADLAANTVTISASATPKTYTEGMTAVFLADTGDGTVEYPGELGPGREFSALLTCELTDSITVSVVFVTGGVQETQILYVYSNLYSGSLPSVHVEDTQLLLWKELSENGELVWDDEYVWFRDGSQAAAGNFATASNAVIGCTEIREMKAGLFRNRELVTWLESCEWPRGQFKGDWSDCQFYRLSDVSIAPEEGDVFALAAVITDEYGREIVCMGAPYALDENNELMYADAAWDKDGWYDQSTWRY